MKRLLAIVLCLCVGPVQAWFPHGAPAASPFIINISWESSALAAPQSFRDAVQAAANILMATYKDAITLNVLIGYNDCDNGICGTNLGTSGATVVFGQDVVTYTNLRAAIVNHATTAVDAGVITSLPAGSSVEGRSSFTVLWPQSKALGLHPGGPRDATLDSATGIGSSVGPNDLQGVILHELTHGMGRICGSGPTDFVKFTAVGTHQFGCPTNPTPYFSFDDGTTNLSNILNADSPSFAGATYLGLTDPLDANYTFNTTYQNFTPLDLEMMDAIGYTPF